jgi:hypothetical protein
MLSCSVVHDPLPDKQHLYVYVVCVHGPYGIASLRPPTKVETSVLSQSPMRLCCSYVVPVTFAFGGLTMTPIVFTTIKATQPKDAM